MSLTFKVIPKTQYTILHFELGDQPLEPMALSSLAPPVELLDRRRLGLVFSGRGPVWLYAWLTHWAHPFAWVATYDPRLDGAVVLSRHVPDAPEVGQVIQMPPTEASE